MKSPTVLVLLLALLVLVTADEKCSTRGGECKDKSQCSPPNSPTPGLCLGNSQRQCCLPPATRIETSNPTVQGGLNPGGNVIVNSPTLGAPVAGPQTGAAFLASIVQEVSPSATVSGFRVQCTDLQVAGINIIVTPIWYDLNSRPYKWTPYASKDGIPTGPWSDVTEGLPVAGPGQYQGEKPVQCNINIINRLARGRPLIGAATTNALGAIVLPDWCTDPAKLDAHHRKGNSITQRCEFYSTCLAPYKCSSDVNDPNSYPVNYGTKYCTRFLTETYPKMRTQAGRDFIDNTLKCLQSSLISRVKTQTTCQELTDFAFNSHPACYTIRATSICRLTQVFEDTSWGIPQRPLDMKDVALTVEGPDLMSQRTAKQMYEVAKTCGSQIVDKIFTSIGNIFLEEQMRLEAQKSPFAQRMYKWKSNRKMHV